MKLVLVTAMLFSVAHAEDPADVARNVYRQNLQTASTNTSVVKDSGSTTGSGASPATQSSINPSAAAGGSSQANGSAVNQAAGQALMAAGSALMSRPPTVPAGLALMAMGMLAMMQSGHDKGAAGQSAATFDASSFGGTSGTNGIDTASVSNGSAVFSDPASVKANKALTDAGYEVTAKGVKTPSGNFVPAAAFGSAGGLAAAGFDAAAVKEAQRITAAVNEEIGQGARVSGVAVNSSGGGGGSASESSSPAEGELTAPTFNNPFALTAKTEQKMLAGKTVNFDGEPIGVRGSNIFDMVHAAYQKKRNLNSFIETASAPVTNRMPASHLASPIKTK